MQARVNATVAMYCMFNLRKTRRDLSKWLCCTVRTALLCSMMLSMKRGPYVLVLIQVLIRLDSMVCTHRKVLICFQCRRKGGCVAVVFCLDH
jgi:hypothetical protein